jgi:hypothetical protein
VEAAIRKPPAVTAVKIKKMLKTFPAGERGWVSP